MLLLLLSLKIIFFQTPLPSSFPSPFFLQFQVSSSPPPQPQRFFPWMLASCVQIVWHAVITVSANGSYNKGIICRPLWTAFWLYVIFHLQVSTLNYRHNIADITAGITLFYVHLYTDSSDIPFVSIKYRKRCLIMEFQTPIFDARESLFRRKHAN